MTVFLDTVGLLAIWDRSDQWHSKAEAAFAELVELRADLITTELVLVECANAAARRPYRSAVKRLRNEMIAGGRLIEPSEEEIETAWAGYCRGEANAAGLVDQVSFAVMRRLQLRKAFTNDQHFRAAGFETLF